MRRYMIRVSRDEQHEGKTTAGTIVEPVNVDMSFYTDSADEAEKRLQREVTNGKLAKGRVYQICPSMGGFEPIRSCAIALDGSARRVFLDLVDGVYSACRRIRTPVASS